MNGGHPACGGRGSLAARRIPLDDEPVPVGGKVFEPDRFNPRFRGDLAELAGKFDGVPIGQRDKGDRATRIVFQHFQSCRGIEHLRRNDQPHRSISGGMDPHFETISRFQVIAPNPNIVRLCGSQAASSLTVPTTSGDLEILGYQPTAPIYPRFAEFQEFEAYASIHIANALPRPLAWNPAIPLN